MPSKGATAAVGAVGFAVGRHSAKVANASGRGVTVFMLGIAVVMLLSSGAVGKGIEWIRKSTTSTRTIPDATAVKNQVPVPGSPGHKTVPSGDYTTTFNPKP